MHNPLEHRRLCDWPESYSVWHFQDTVPTFSHKLIGSTPKNSRCFSRVGWLVHSQYLRQAFQSPPHQCSDLAHFRTDSDGSLQRKGTIRVTVDYDLEDCLIAIRKGLALILCARVMFSLFLITTAVWARKQFMRVRYIASSFSLWDSL